MTAPSKVSEMPRAAISAARVHKSRKFPVSDGAPVEVVEDGASLAGRLMALAAMLTVKPTLAIGSYAPRLPWPFGLVDLACRVLRACTGHGAGDDRAAELQCAAGTRRRGAASRRQATRHRLHARRRIPHLRGEHPRPAGGGVVEVRLQPRARRQLSNDPRSTPSAWRSTTATTLTSGLRPKGYNPEQIVLAGDSAGGYLSLALAERLQKEGLAGETPAAIVTLSPLFEIDNESRANHPNISVDVMFPPKAFTALVDLVEAAARRNIVYGKPEEVFELLDHIEPGLPRTLIHVSGSEVLLNDARKAAHMLAAAGVPVEVRVWPGQMHVFQIAAPAIKEATRSLRQVGDDIREATW